MNYEELKWINQSLYSYKDKRFESHGYLDISVSLNTSDDINFSQPKLVFNLDNQGQRRHVRLSYSDVVDLLEAFNLIGQELQIAFQNNEACNITRRYNKDKDFIFEFVLHQGVPVVTLKIFHNTSDAGRIIFPKDPELITIGRILRMFEANYIKFSTDLPTRYLTSLNSIKLQSVETLLKILPTQITPIQNTGIHVPTGVDFGCNDEDPDDLTNYPDKGAQEVKYNGLTCPDCGEPQFDTPSGATCKNGHGGLEGIDPAEQTNEFDEFAEDNVDKVRIPELESDVIEPKEPISQEFSSPFIEGVLKNNILNLDQMINALLTNNNPLRTIMDSIYNGEGYTLLPGINEDDLKSAMYISNLYFKLNFQSYIQNQTALPLIIPIVKYHTDEEIDRKTIEISYDLLMINAYLKLYRNRMEAINSDPYTNGALTHFCFRCFLDIMTFSFLNGQNAEATKSIVMARFKYFRETGFFDNFDKNLIAENQKPIHDGMIAEFMDKVFENVLEQEDIDVRHFNAFDNGSVKLPPKNSFNLEQITNEIVKYEIKILFGQRIEDLTTDEEITLLFNKKLKKKYKPTDHKPTPRKKETHLLRYIKLKANELPENKRDDFIKLIEDLGDNVYNYFNETFKLEELPEIIIQAIYIWNSFIDNKMKYTDYATQVEDCISKELIISKVKEEYDPEHEGYLKDMKELEESENKWSDNLNDLANIEF